MERGIIVGDYGDWGFDLDIAELRVTGTKRPATLGHDSARGLVVRDKTISDNGWLDSRTPSQRLPHMYMCCVVPKWCGEGGYSWPPV